MPNYTTIEKAVDIPGEVQEITADYIVQKVLTDISLELTKEYCNSTALAQVQLIRHDQRFALASCKLISGSSYQDFAINLTFNRKN